MCSEAATRRIMSIFFCLGRYATLCYCFIDICYKYFVERVENAMGFAAQCVRSMGSMKTSNFQKDVMDNGLCVSASTACSVS